MKDKVKMIYLLSIVVLLTVQTEATINAPKKSDRIAVVGAGPAGVHMAYILKKAGFNNVVIFEKEYRIGGKSLSIQYGGVRHEMGTCFLSADYEEIVRLVGEVGAGNVIEYPPRVYWMNETVSGSSLEYLMHSTGITDPTEMAITLYTAGINYITLHQELFGVYEGSLMPRPNRTVLDKITGTFSEFLQRNDLDILEAAFNISYTTQGYGYLNKEPALYGLMWITPKLVQSIIDPNIPSLFAIDKGFQPLWEKMIWRYNIDVKLGVDIKRIVRRRILGKPNIKIFYEFRSTIAKKDIKSDIFDFLVLTPNMKSLIDIVDFTPSEKCRFNKLTKKSYYVTTLVDSDPGVRYSPAKFFTYNIISPPEFDVWGSVDNYAAVNYITGENYTLGLTPGSDYCSAGCQTAVYYQYGEVDPWVQKERIRRELTDQLITNQQTNFKVVNQQIWPYFNRFRQEDIENEILWDILDMQGTKNTWYTGASVSFESAKSVVDYNNYLFRLAGLTGTKK